MEQQPIKFECGKVYYCESFANPQTKYHYVVVSRTDKSVLLRDEIGKYQRKKIKFFRFDSGVRCEFCTPTGGLAMNPILAAMSKA